VESGSSLLNAPKGRKPQESWVVRDSSKGDEEEPEDLMGQDSEVERNLKRGKKGRGTEPTL
jgi:hypothetical protein